MKKIALTVLVVAMLSVLPSLAIAFNTLNLSSNIRYYSQNDDGDRVSGNTMTSTAQSPTDIMDTATLEVTRFEAHEVANVGGSVICHPAITQLFPDSENPENWMNLWGTGATTTGATVGSFNEATMTFKGDIFPGSNGLSLYDSAVEGAPSGRLYFTYYYGSTDDTIHIRAKDYTAGGVSTLFLGSVNNFSIISQDAVANLDIESQTQVGDVYILKGSILFNTPANDVKIELVSSTRSSTKTISLYGFDLSYDSDIWDRHISNKSVFGPEINTSDNWGLTNVTQNGSQLTFTATVADAIAQLGLTGEFIDGEIYLITFDIIAQDFQHLFRLGDGESGFVASPTTIFSYAPGPISIRVPCAVAGGRLRILIPHDFYPGVGIIDNVSCRKILSDIRVVSSRKNTISNWFGPADGSEDIIDGDMEGSEAVWFNYGSPAVNVRSSEQAHSGTYSRKIQNDNVSGEAGLRTSMFTTITGELRKIHLWVWPVDDIRTLAVAVRKGDDSDWALTRFVFPNGGLIAGQWNEVVYEYTETAGGAGAYMIMYDTGINANRYYIDDVSCKTISKKTMETAYPAFYKSNDNGNISFTWIPSKGFATAVAGLILNSGDFDLGYAADGSVYFSDGVNTATVAGVNWKAHANISISAIYGPDYDFFGANRMKLTVDGVASTKEQLISNFTFGDWMTWLNSAEGGSIADLKIDALKQSSW